MNVVFPPLKTIINESFIPLFYNRDRYLILWGGRGSSKSVFAAKKIIYECLRCKYFRYILIRETYASIKDSQYQTIKDIVNEMGLQSLFSFKENPLEIRCSNGNIIYARGCDDVEKIKSIKDPSGAWYEEGNNIKLSDFITITTSIRTSKADYLQEIITMNPECDEKPEDFWINQVFGLIDQKERLERKELEIKLSDDETLRTSFTRHHSTYKDNRWCGKEFIAFLEQLKQIDPYHYDTFCLGQWGTKKGLNPFAREYDTLYHNAPVVFQPDKQLIISVDFNINPFAITFYNLWRDREAIHLHAFDEAEIEGGTLQKMTALILDRYKNYLHRSELTGDFQGNKKEISQSDLASLFVQLQRGLRIAPSQVNVSANPSHENSRADCNYILHQSKNNSGIDFKVNPVKCPNLCRDLKTVQCDPFGHIIKQKRSDLTQRADYLDTWRYVIHNYLRKTILEHQKRAA